MLICNNKYKEVHIDNVGFSTCKTVSSMFHHSYNLPGILHMSPLAPNQTEKIHCISTDNKAFLLKRN